MIDWQEILEIGVWFVWTLIPAAPVILLLLAMIDAKSQQG